MNYLAEPCRLQRFKHYLLDPYELLEEEERERLSRPPETKDHENLEDESSKSSSVKPRAEKERPEIPSLAEEEEEQIIRIIKKAYRMAHKRQLAGVESELGEFLDIESLSEEESEEEIEEEKEQLVQEKTPEVEVPKPSESELYVCMEEEAEEKEEETSSEESSPIGKDMSKVPELLSKLVPSCVYEYYRKKISTDPYPTYPSPRHLKELIPVETVMSRWPFTADILWEIFQMRGDLMLKEGNIFYYPEEVAIQTRDPIWVSAFGLVFDITEILADYSGEEYSLILEKYAGHDLTYCFDEYKEPLIHVKPGSNRRTHFSYPYGHCDLPRPLFHAPPGYCRLPWWKDPRRVIGKLTAKKRKVKIVNMLTLQADVVRCCDEEPLRYIMVRYLRYNFHNASYVLRYRGCPLDLHKTLDENGIPDIPEELIRLNDEKDEALIPIIHAYFSDDLTLAHPLDEA